MADIYHSTVLITWRKHFSYTFVFLINKEKLLFYNCFILKSINFVQGPLGRNAVGPCDNHVLSLLIKACFKLFVFFRQFLKYTIEILRKSLSIPPFFFFPISLTYTQKSLLVKVLGKARKTFGKYLNANQKLYFAFYFNLVTTSKFLRFCAISYPLKYVFAS